LRLVFLGAGGWISKPLLGHTSILVVEGESRLLLDAGEGAAKALYLYGGGLKGLSGVVVTHLHGDHVLGLPTILMLARHEGVVGMRILTHKALLGSLDFLLKVLGVGYEGVAELVGVEAGSEERVGPFTLRFIEARHTTPALSVRVDAGGKCVVYSGDTSYNPELAELARGCSVLIHEAAGHDPSARLHGHSTVEDAVRVAVEARVEKLVLAHYYVEAPFLRQIPAEYKLEVALAYPGFEVAV
jgi:ribonuclease Z